MPFLLCIYASIFVSFQIFPFSLDTQNKTCCLLAVGVNWNNLPSVSLTVLSLGGNLLTEVPDTVGNLHQLQGLTLCDNLIEMLPAGIARLTNLKSLLLHKNRLRHLPRDIITLKNLVEVSETGSRGNTPLAHTDYLCLFYLHIFTSSSFVVVNQYNF